jgi:hypothetical protein
MKTAPELGDVIRELLRKYTRRNRLHRRRLYVLLDCLCQPAFQPGPADLPLLRNLKSVLSRRPDPANAALRRAVLDAVDVCIRQALGPHEPHSLKGAGVGPARMERSVLAQLASRGRSLPARVPVLELEPGGVR